MHVIDKPFADLTTAELYAILRLRVDVFVVEQACPYAELDGRDVEPATRHLWVPARQPVTDVLRQTGGVSAYLRVLRDPEGVRIGRVVTHPVARGGGLGRMLFQVAVDANSSERIDIDAQTYLRGWYESFGFHVAGDEFLDAGIPHIAMTRMPTN